MKQDAKNIVEMLAAQHAEDVFVPECKGGPTWGADFLRMDAWMMRKSWSRPLVRAYEVKVARADFIRDDKWRKYLEFCNEFYFVCPAKLIAPEELPPEAGLMYVASTGTRFFVKKKSPQRDVQIPESIFRYLLMSRAKIHGETIAEQQSKSQRIEAWREWLAEREEGREIGYIVRRAVREHVDAVEAENVKLKQENAALALFKQRLHELGCDPSAHVCDWVVRDQLRKLTGSIPPWVERLPDEIERVARALRELMDKNKSTEAAA